MKSLIFSILILNIVLAQNPWKIHRQASLSEYLLSPFFIDENLGWVSAYNGTIYNTTDGGASWSTQQDSSLTISDINDIYFINSSTGWACGDGGTILYTTDGGSTWNASNMVPTSQDLRSIHFPDNLNGYACGNSGVIIKSTNGGLDWVLLSSGYSNDVLRIKFFDTDHGIAMFRENTNTVLYTSTAGYLWESTSYTLPPGHSLTRMKDLDIVKGASDAWMTGYHGVVLHSPDKGQNWNHITSFYDLTKYGLYTSAIRFYNDQIGFVGGDNGTIFRTFDGGVYWDTVSVGTNERVTGICFTDSQKIIAMAENDQIRKSIDGGNTWIPIVDWPKTYFNSIGLADSNNVIFASFGGDISLSDNGGTNLSFPSNINLPSMDNIETIKFFDQNIGFYGTKNGQIAKSTDGGQTWYLTNVSGELKGIKDFAFVNGNVMWACGSSGKIYKSIDGGENWNEIKDFGNSANNAITFLSLTKGFTISNDGKIYQCLDGDTSWALIDEFYSIALTDIEFIDDNTGYVIGQDGIFGKTVNGGNDWFIADTLNFTGYDSLFLTSIEFVNSNEAWISGGISIGNRGNFFYTNDAGNSWELYDSPSGNKINALKFFSPKIGWAVDQYGTIFKFDFAASIDPKGISQSPESFELYENYPNPFNPETHIRYYLNISGEVKLSIYNIAGQKIRTIVNEHQKKGPYHFTWNGRNDKGIPVGSGYYIYQLQLNDQISAKRMILIK